jgi:hypothetical protein
MLIVFTGCNDKSYKYNYSRLEIIAINLSEVYNEMKEVSDSSNKMVEWNNKKTDLASKLEDIQVKIDSLPTSEKEPKDKNDVNSQQFNDSLYFAREIQSKLQNIEDLLYCACTSDSYFYFDDIVSDFALEDRIHNLIDRASKEGIVVSLPKQDTSLEVPSYDDEADITIEYEDIQVKK